MEEQAAIGQDGEHPPGPSSSDLFDGVFAAWRGTLIRGHLPGAIAAIDLRQHQTFAGLIDRFQAARGGPDRAAATSFWSQCYFSTLIVPAVATILYKRLGLPLGFGDMQVDFCSKTGVPLHFALKREDAHPRDTPPFEALIEGHLTPFIAMVRRQSGLSSRLLWENAGWYLVWIVQEMSRMHPACLPLAQSFLADNSWPAAHRNAIDGMKKAALGGQPVTRRVCCLRYRNPGFGRCEGICPLRELPPDRPTPPMAPAE